jgi:hypothetical protein
MKQLQNSERSAHLPKISESIFHPELGNSFLRLRSIRFTSKKLKVRFFLAKNKNGINCQIL